MLKKIMLAFLFVSTFFIFKGFQEVKAEPFYLTINNLYDDGQFDAYAGATATPIGWESVYNYNKVPNPTGEEAGDFLYSQSRPKSTDFSYSGNYSLKTTYEWGNMLTNLTIGNEYFIRLLNYRPSGTIAFGRLGLDINYFFNDTNIYPYDTWNEFYTSYVAQDVNDYILAHGGTDFVYWDDIYLYDFTNLKLENTNPSQFNEGLTNSDSFFFAGSWTTNETGLSENFDGIYFYDSSYNQYNYDLSNVSDAGDIFYISYDIMGPDDDRVCIIDDCFYTNTSEFENKSNFYVADDNFKFTIGNFTSGSYGETHAYIDNIMIINLTDLFGSSNIPSFDTWESDYMNAAPKWFDTWEFLFSDITIANEGDLEVGTIPKDDYLKEYSYLYMGYKQEYNTLNLWASEDAVIENCKADFLFMNEWFGLNANENTCQLDETISNYPYLLDLLQDGVVKSDLEHDSYFRIQYDNIDHLNRETVIGIQFDEMVQNVRTVVIALGDDTSINDFNKITYIFRYHDFIVGFENTMTTNLSDDNVIVLNIYNTMMTYDSITILFNQEGIAQAQTDFSLTELAFLKDTLVTTPIGNRTLQEETEFLITFEIDYNSCGNWDIGCHLKNGAIWLVMDSPISESLWLKYGETFDQTYNLARTQQSLIDTINQDGAGAAIGGIIAMIGGLFSLMVYSFISRFFK